MDSAHLFVERDTFPAKYPTLLKHLDHNFYFTNGNGTQWYRLVDTSSLHSEIVNLQNTKVNYSDSTNLFVTQTTLKDTAAAIRNSFPNNGVDSIWANNDTVYWKKLGTTHYTIVDTFSTNPTVYGTSFGKYGAGSTPTWRGLSSKQAIIDAITQCNHPTYVTPSNSISASPSFGNYEIGTNLGTITLSHSYTQNDGGSETATTYYQNSVALGGNTTTITSLTTTQTFYVNSAYGTGACKNNNCGQLDCTGQILAGSVNSSVNGYTPYYKRYWGVCVGTTPTNTEILTATGGGSEFATTFTKGAFNVSVPNGSYYHVFYVYLSSWGSISQIKDNNGLDITGIFVNGSSPVTITVTNAQGNSFTAKAYVSSNTYTNTTFGFNSIN